MNATVKFLILLIIFLTLGTGMYLGFRNTFGTHAQPSAVPTPVVPTHAPLLITETTRLLNPSKTFGFFFRSTVPAFDPTNTTNTEKPSVNPTAICFNGDTLYAVPTDKYIANEMEYVIKPIIVNLQTNQEYELPSVGDVKAANGCVRITGWSDDTHLGRNSSGGDITSFNTSDVVAIK